MSISLSQTWLYIVIGKIIIGCYLCLGIGYWIGSYKVTYEENHHYRVVYPWIRNGQWIGSKQIVHWPIPIPATYTLEMIEVAIYWNEWMVVPMHICTHIYLHPCISTQYIHQYLTIPGIGEILFPIPIPIPNFNTTQDHGEISHTNWAPNSPAVVCNWCYCIYRWSNLVNWPMVVRFSGLWYCSRCSTHPRAIDIKINSDRC